MKLYLKYSLVIIIVLCITACTSIKEPKLVSLNNVVMNSSGDSFAVTTDITLYNPNIFALRSKDVKLELFIDSLFIGEILLMNDFYIRKQDTLSLKTKIILESKLFDQPLSLKDTLDLRVKGSAKVPFVPINHKFNANYQLLLSDLIDPLLENNLKESDIKFKEITIKKIRFSTVDILTTLAFKNNFNFDYTIKELNIEIFDSAAHTNLVGKSSIKNAIQVGRKSEVDIDSAVSLNTAKLGTSILKNLFKKTQTLFIKVNAIIVFNQIKVPVSILKQVDYNPITKEIKLQ